MRIRIIGPLLIPLILSLAGLAFAQIAEIRVSNETAPPSGWAVISLKQGTEPRPVGSGQGGLTTDAQGATAGLMTAPGDLFLYPPLLLVENTTGDLSYRIDEAGPNGIRFSFESTIADVGVEYERPFAYLALRVSPSAPVGAQAVLSLAGASTAFFDEAGQPLDLILRDGLFKVGGLSITCMSPLTGMVMEGDLVTIFGVGFEAGNVDVEFGGMKARRPVTSEANKIVVRAPMDFLADTVEVKVRNRTRGPDGVRPENKFVSYRFGCLDNP